MSTQTKQTNTSRRRFMQDTARTVCGVSLMGLGLGFYSRQTHSLAPIALRPPGVKNENDFLGACIRCGLCVRDCPYDILKLSTFAEDIPLGTPYFNARKIPCEMCEDIPCVKACPANALDKELTNIDDARMGLAVIVDQETCLNYQGLRCDVCHRVCPLINKAITLEPRHNQRTGKHTLFIPIVHSESCTGCGKCERACVLEEAAIKILPFKLAKGELGHHYRLGWEEKEKAGKSLVTPDFEHKYNLPEGLKYEHEGQGLMKDSR